MHDGLGGALLAGLVVGAPAGPVGAMGLANLCRARPLAAAACGLGSAAGDAVWAMAAAAGVHALIPPGVRAWWSLLAVAGLGAIAVATARQALRAAPVAAEPGGGWRALLVTLANPSVVAGYALWFSATGRPAAPADLAWAGLGVLAGSAAWWLAIIPAGLAWRGRLAGLGPRPVGLASAGLYLAAAVGIAAAG